MKKNIIVLLLWCSTAVLGMQDGGDWVKKQLYWCFAIERHYDAMNIVPRYTGEIGNDLKRQAGLKLHPDKHPGQVEYYTELFKKIDPAFVILSNQQKKEEYDTLLTFIDLYAFAIKASAVIIPLYSLWCTYQWYQGLGKSNPDTALQALSTQTATIIDALLNNKIDRYSQRKEDFLLSQKVDIEPVLNVLSEQSASALTQTIARVDAIIEMAFTKIAWDLYDCQSVQELQERDPELVALLATAIAQVTESVNMCKKELTIDTGHSSVRGIMLPFASISGGLALGALWMRYKAFDGSKPVDIPRLG